MLMINESSLLSNDDGYFQPGHRCGLHGVKYLSCNRLGHLFWKGSYVASFEPVTLEKYDEVAQELGLICANLERLGVPVNPNTAGTRAHWFNAMPMNEPYKTCLSRCPDIHLGRDCLLIQFKRAACEFDGRHWQYYLLGSFQWHARWLYNRLYWRGNTAQSLAESSLDDVRYCLVHFNVPVNLLTVMAQHLNPGCST